MVVDYIYKRDQSNEVAIMEFHRRHLILFLRQFCQFLGFHETPSSRLLSHDFFLLVKAATIVAKSDWVKCEKADADCSGSFSNYFDAFDELVSGLVPLDKGAVLCLEALTRDGKQ